MNADRQQLSSAPARPSRLKQRLSPSRAGLSVVAGGRPRDHVARASPDEVGLHHAARGGSPRRLTPLRPMGVLGIEPLHVGAGARPAPPVTIASPVAGVGPFFVGHRGLLPLPFVVAALLAPGTRSLMAAAVGVALVVVGFALRLAAAAARSRPGDGLVTWGAYAWLRHPHDLGTILAWAGVIVAGGAFAALPALVVGIAMMHVFAAHGEERALAARFGEEFARWRRRTPGWIPCKPIVSLARGLDPLHALYAERGALAGFALLLAAAALGGVAG